VRHCQFPPPEVAAPDISPEFARIILRALQANPADRYQTAEEMLVDIETVQRAAFRPAGQTELKRWLSELQQRDNAPTISRAPGPPAEDEALQLDDSADLIFDDSSQIAKPPEVPVRPTQPTVAAVPALLPTVHVEQPQPMPLPRLKPGRRLVLFSLVGGAAALLAWLGLRNTTAPRPRPASAPRPPAASPTPATRQPASSPPAPASAPPSPAPTSLPTPPAPPPSTQAGKSPSPTGQPAAGEEIRPQPLAGANEEIRPQPPQADDEEAALLKQSEPAAPDQVLGEAEGEPAAENPGKQGASAKRELPESVSVHIDSRPTGAVVKLKDRVFGRSPLNLRFRPGIIYELTFVKKGYQTTSKRFTVRSRKNQRITITLSKKTAPKKRSLIRRIFGGK
jgi:hypothetical protein